MGGMCENVVFIQNLKLFVKKMTDKLKIFVSLLDPVLDWFNQLPLGIFAEIVRQLIKIE